MPSTTSAAAQPLELDSDTSVRAALRSPRRLRTEVLAGLVVALALIPEAISFSIIAGVDPRVGLFASFTMAVTIAFVGGRPAMISAATGAVALVIAPAGTRARPRLPDRHGDAGRACCRSCSSLLGVAKLMRFVPRSVMVGFVNALAILIFIAQLPHLIGVPWLVYPMVAVGIAIMVFLPAADHGGSGAAGRDRGAHRGRRWCSAVNVPTVGDEGALPDSLPSLVLPDVPLTWRRCGSSRRTRWRWRWSACWSR